MTDAPILSDDIEYDDEGEVVRVGLVYWYPQYDVADLVVQVLASGSVAFERVQ